MLPHISASLRLCGRPSPNGFTEQTMPSALLAQRFGVHGAGFHAGTRRRGTSGVLTVFGGCHLVLAGAPLGGGLEPWFVSPFQGLDGWWAGQPGALPRADVCRAVGAHEPCKASHVWGHRVEPLLDSSDPTPALDPTDAVEEPAFHHVSASLRLCGRPSPNGFTEQTMPSAVLAQRFGMQGAGFHAEARSFWGPHRFRWVSPGSRRGPAGMWP